MTAFFKGIRYFFSGFRLALKKQLIAFLIIPLLVNSLLFAGVIFFCFEQFQETMTWIADTLPDWLDWLVWLLWPLFILVILVIVFQIFTFVGNLILAPFNGLLAERVEKMVNGTIDEMPFEWKTLPSLVARSFRREFSKLGYIAIRLIPLLILMLIPGINLITALVWFFFGSWMMAVEYIDYPVDNQKKMFLHLKEFLGQRRMLVLGFGMTVLFFSTIPLINFFVMPIAVVSGTLLYLKES